MTTLSQRGNRGFTLIELLIVVIIIAILAAIAIPQFSSSTSDAQASAMDANLATIRSAIEQYRVQHNNIYPGDVTSTGTCTTGTNIAGTADTAAALNAQLQGYTNAAGLACDTPSADYKYGPYLRQGVPVEPVTSVATIKISVLGNPIAANTDGGWAYDTKSGQFIANNTALDSNKKAFSTH
jgi:prepilin-type N-terminal cleavage/methylation domain-containing protein